MNGPRRRDPVFAEVFGMNLARCREVVGVSQEELGFMADLHRTAVGQLERGERIARSDTLLRLCASLGVTAEELFKGLSWTPPRYTSGRLVVAIVTEDGEAEEHSDATEELRGSRAGLRRFA
jgi:transcriptional regulator with XRE-family HTH domain